MQRPSRPARFTFVQVTKESCMRLTLILAAIGLCAIPALPASSAGAQSWRDHREYRGEVREEWRECRRELRRADSRREYRRELRECRRELADARRDYRRDWRDGDRRWGHHHDRRYRDGRRWRRW
jgi:hypothetical protein